jgi:uncharacterized protein (TIGR02246 family)
MTYSFNCLQLTVLSVTADAENPPYQPEPAAEADVRRTIEDPGLAGRRGIMNRAVLGLCVGALLVSVGCSRQSSVDLSAESNAIRQLDREWVDAIADKDVEALVAFYAPDGVLMNANAPAVVGRDAIREWFEAALQSPNLTYNFTPEVIEVAASGDLAYDRGTYRLAMDSPQGHVEDKGKYVAVWKKIGNDWKVVVDIMNSDIPLGTR